MWDTAVTKLIRRATNTCSNRGSAWHSANVQLRLSRREVWLAAWIRKENSLVAVRVLIL